MFGEIVSTDVWMLALELQEPVDLGFGTLRCLPRVFYRLGVDSGSEIIHGYGEASIDFPFAKYDAWDIYYVLEKIDLLGRSVLERETILNDAALRHAILDKFPAAFAALNMALDDVAGHIESRSVLDIYGRIRSKGKALASIGFESVDNLIQKVDRQRSFGRISKLKGGQEIPIDLEMLDATGRYSSKHEQTFAADFNGHYSPEDFASLVVELCKRQFPWENLLFIEQPSKDTYGIDGLVAVRTSLRASGITTPVMADESFVTAADAAACHSAGLLLNYKIQKIGGIWVAREIEQMLGTGTIDAMVGGTFPTAVGRAYDQQAASVLRSATLPSDGWQPSQDWFQGDQHVIHEDFRVGLDGSCFPFDGNGLGITLQLDRIARLKIADPHMEYSLIRNSGTGGRLAVTLRQGKQYGAEYSERTGRSPDWNL